jgi:periplasmic divalent cation tolerance protein
MYRGFWFHYPEQKEIGDKLILFYIPCPDKSTAENIAKVLLNERLVGCANIVSGMESFYWWEGKIETNSECILLLKTFNSPQVQEKISQRVAKIHPYEIPCILTARAGLKRGHFHRFTGPMVQG